MNEILFSGARVKHMRFGDGTLSACDGHTAKITFDSGEERAFAWPESFGTFITTDDQALLSAAAEARDAKKQSAADQLRRFEESVAALKPEPMSKKAAASRQPSKKASKKISKKTTDEASDKPLEKTGAAQ